MKNQVLSIEQMQELIELGIDISKASMCWIGCADGKDVYPYNSTFKDIFESHKETIPSVLIPTFTLQDILTFFNSYQILKLSDEVTLEIRFNGRWVHNEFKDNLLSIAFNMLKWCKQNNYI